MTPKFATTFGSMGASQVPVEGYANENGSAIRESCGLATAIVSLLMFISLLAFLSLAWSAPALSAEPADTLVLVARPAVRDLVYGRSILVAHKMPGGRHMGFILNKPTTVKLIEAFPSHAASKSVTDPLYLGGPSSINAVFALVQGQTIPMDGTLALTKDLYLAISESAVDKAILSAAEERARFFVGAMVWQPGELEAEIQHGAWYVLEATSELVLPKHTGGLWEELAQQADIAANGI